jgi:O-antigen/teichoic acid export membrane protein/glycosyltransferase involved in cell wall biosynthesis
MRASIDGSATYQRHQALTDAFLAAGAEVFFVENTGFRQPSLADLGRVFKRLKRLLRPARKTSNRRVISPFVLPPTHRVFRAINAVHLVPLLLGKLKRRGLRERPLVFAYLPTETTLQILDRIQPETIVYDCVDNFHGHPHPPLDLARTERALLDRAALVLTTSIFLEERLKKKHGNVFRLHHGTDEAFFDSEASSRKHYKRFCYFGTLWDAVDYEAIRLLAEAGFSIDLIGPIKEPPPPMPDNVRFLTPVAHRMLPRALRKYDGFLLPYGKTDYNKGVVPAKLYECLATGKPVLCSPLPSIDAYRDLLELARTPEDFPKIAKRLSETETAERRERRIAAAMEHTTERQAKRIIARLEKAAPPPRQETAPHPAGVTFLKGFSWIFLWFAAARGVSILTQFIAAHWLGPDAFGTAHLIIAVAGILLPGISLGFPIALSRFGAAAVTPTQKRRTISTSLWLFILWAGGISAGLLFFHKELSAIANLPAVPWRLCAPLAALTAVHHVLGGGLQGLKRFRERGTAESLYAFGSLAVVAGGVALGWRATELLIGGLTIGFTFAILYSLTRVSAHLSPAFDSKIARKVLPFALLGTINFVSLALVQSPGRIATYYLESPDAAGIFSVYFMTTIQIALALGNMVQAVLIPVSSGESGQREIWGGLRSIHPLAIGACWAAFAAAAAIVLSLIGSRYPLEPLWITIFSCAASLALVHGALASVFAARGLRGLSVSVSSMMITGAANAAATLFLTARWGIPGAGTALLGSYALGVAWLLFQIPRLRESRP